MRKRPQLACFPREHVLLNVDGANVCRRQQNILELDATNIFNLLSTELSAHKITDNNYILYLRPSYDIFVVFLSE